MENTEEDINKKIEMLERKLATAQKWMARQVEESIHPKTNFLGQAPRKKTFLEKLLRFRFFKHKPTLWELWMKRFEAFLVGAAIILFWRGIWALGDLYIFPNHPTISAIVSMVVGITILILSKNFVNQFLDEAVEEAEEYE